MRRLEHHPSDPTYQLATSLTLALALTLNTIAKLSDSQMSSDDRRCLVSGTATSMTSPIGTSSSSGGSAGIPGGSTCSSIGSMSRLTRGDSTTSKSTLGDSIISTSERGDSIAGSFS